MNIHLIPFYYFLDIDNRSTAQEKDFKQLDKSVNEILQVKIPGISSCIQEYKSFVLAVKNVSMFHFICKDRSKGHK